MEERQEIAFLLGAGAVVDAGLPDAVRLAELVEEAIERDHPELLPAVRFIGGAVEFGKACRGERITQRPNIEELLMVCALLARRERDPAYPFVASWHEKVAQFSELKVEGNGNAYEFLGQFCRMGLRKWLAIGKPEPLKYLRSFKDFLNQGLVLRIFTLNYDECVELTLKDVLGDINKAWTTGFDERGWRPELLDKDRDVILYKLHGSLDWIDDEKLGVCSIAWPQAEESEELPDETDPCLVFGRNDKLQARDPFLTLLFHFQRVLERAKVLVAIGYSFNDPHVNSMITEAMGRDPQMRIVVVDKRGLESVGEEFRRLVDTERRVAEVKATARDAFEKNIVLNEVGAILKTQMGEAPFR